VAERHRELFGAKNHDVKSLWCKFNAIANMVPPTGDPNIPAYIQLAKDIMRAIKVRMDSGDVVAGDLGIEGVDDFEEEEEEPAAGDDANNLLEEFNGDDLVGELPNNQQPEGAQLRNHLLCNDLPVGLNNRIMVPKMPAVAVAPYQPYLATGSVTRPPFVANCSAGKFSAEDYYQQMMQEIEEQGREHHRAEQEERLAELEIQRQEREQKLEEEKRQRECDREEERREQAEERKAQREMMNMLMMGMVGCSMSGDDSPARKRREK